MPLDIFEEGNQENLPIRPIIQKMLNAFVFWIAD
jgi:hypothetical protein